MADIVCKKCGTHAGAGDAFCGGCGAFLEWEGEAVAGEPSSPTVPAAVPTAEPTIAAAPPPATTPESNTTPEPDTPVVASAPAPNVPTGSPAPAPAPAPAPTAQPMAMQPAVVPERTRPRVAHQVPVRPAEPDDLVCSSCGQGNPSDRRFCGRCGASLLAVATAPVKVPWWRRIFGRKSPAAAPAAPAATEGTAATAGAPAAGSAAPPTPPRAPAVHKAPPSSFSGRAPRARTPQGMRMPRRGLGGGKSVLIILVVIVAAAAVVFGVPSIRNKVLNIKSSLTSRYQKVPVATATATGVGSCTAPLLTGNNTVYWYTQPSGAATQVLTVNVAPSFTGSVSRIAFTPLKPSTRAPAAGAASPNPQQLLLTSTPASSLAAIPLTLTDPPAFQVLGVTVTKPTQIQLHLAATDAGAASGTCAETGVVFYSKG